MKSMGPEVELLILEEKLRALNTLVMYEIQPEKRDAYKVELGLVASELKAIRRTPAPPLAFRASA